MKTLTATKTARSSEVAEFERRIASLERSVASLVNRFAQPPKKDWRKSIGIFGDDPIMKEILDEAAKYRERDRAKARRRFARSKRGGQA